MKAAAEEGFVVDGHQFLEDGEIGLGVVGNGEESSKDARLHQDQGFAPLPVTAECGESLPRAGFALFLGFSGDFLGGEKAFDQTGPLAPGEGDNVHVGFPDFSGEWKGEGSSAESLRRSN